MITTAIHCQGERCIFYMYCDDNFFIIIIDYYDFIYNICIIQFKHNTYKINIII